LKSKYDRLIAARQSAVDKEFGDQLAEYSRAFYDLPRSADEQYSQDELVEHWNTLTTNVENLLSKSPDISAGQKQEGDRLLNSIARRKETFNP